MLQATQIVQEREAIFESLPIPPFLKLHLLRVAAVADTICKSWQGPPLDADAIVAASLFHDIGNIVKMQFPAHDPWRRRQVAIIAQYGSDENVVRDMLLQKLDVDSRIQTLIRLSRGKHLQDRITEQNFEAMIYLYADNRVMPQRICSLPERMADADQRYPGYYARTENATLRESLFKVEALLQERTSIPLDLISDILIAEHPFLKQTER